MKNIYLLICSFCFISFLSLAQNVEFEKEFFKDQKDQLKEAKENIKMGDNLYKEGPEKYKTALIYYLKANDFNPNNALLNYKIGTCYLYSSYKIKARDFIEKAYKINPNVSPEIHFKLGQVYQLDLEWANAIKEYQAAKPMVGKEVSFTLPELEKKIKECQNGIELVQNPVRVFIDNVGTAVNSSYPDYGPVISADEDILIFTSRRNGTTGGGIDEFINEPFEDIYVSYSFNNKWTTPKNIGPPINTNGHDATVGLSPDGQTLLIYKDDKGNGNIYACDLEGEVWSKPEKLSKAINTDSHESSASLSFDGKTVYFVSDRPNGIGGRDLYMCTKDAKGKWEKAVNLGPKINTPYNEEGVFMLPDGKTLFFSSQGHNSMGGYDIFKTTFENGLWTAPVNIGYPINSADDDVFFVMSASGKRGYYASIKKDGVGDKDIYVITFLGPEKPVVLNTEDNLLASLTAPVSETVIAPTVALKTNLVTILKGIVTDFGTLAPIEAQLELMDNTTNLLVAEFKSNSKTGKFLVSLPSGKNYGLAVKADGYLFHSENFDIPETAAYKEVTLDVKMKKVLVGSSIVLRNIFFDFDKATLRQESTAELERLIKLLNENPTLKIEISGHTDAKGAAAYNLTLSDNRSKSVVDYLVAKGISKDRLTYKGYGLTQPIASNDTEEGRQMNRRTEFKILSK